MENLLGIHDLHVSVEDKELLKGVELTIPQGEVHALLGPNGCGKTTLMMAVMGFSKYRVTRGRIVFDGGDVTGLELDERARRGLGIALQRPPTIPGVRLGDILDYAAADDEERFEEVDRYVDEARMRPFLNRAVNQDLSGGEIKRSEVLQLLATKPRFVMLDEPGSGVDLDSLVVLGRLINDFLTRDEAHPARRKAGLIITHSAHILDYVAVDKAHVMLDGRLTCHGNPRLVLEKIRRCGFEECVRCLGAGEEAAATRTD
ncbi:MAG: ATP-binding cassette domain-containing protein [Candidatus Coatesbacteria bacterium]|nr:ATP-binding cassette domain-containing protein [Candidatus Coatesbacteria bacterium]